MYENYDLEVSNDGTNHVIAEDIQIADIPLKPYLLRSSESEIEPIIPATIDFHPDTLNLKNKGKWVTVYIELPEGHGYDLRDIEIESIILNDQVPVDLKHVKIIEKDDDKDNDDDDDEEKAVLKVKFKRKEVQKILEPGNHVEIVVSGRLSDGRLFEGTDYIKVK